MRRLNMSNFANSIRMILGKNFLPCLFYKDKVDQPTVKRFKMITNRASKVSLQKSTKIHFNAHVKYFRKVLILTGFEIMCIIMNSH